jgi:hypothetical protein
MGALTNKLIQQAVQIPDKHTTLLKRVHNRFIWKGLPKSILSIFKNDYNIESIKIFRLITDILTLDYNFQ